MKKILFIVLILVGIGCEEKEVFLYPTIEEGALFTIKTSDFEDEVVISVGQINEAISDATDGEGIEDVILESIWLEITPKSGNTAQEVTMDLAIQSWQSQQFIGIVNDFVVKIGDKPSKLIVIKGLLNPGVEELKKQLDEIIVKQAGQNITFETEATVAPHGAVVK